MRVTRHPPDKHIQFDYTLHQQRLEQVQSAKYLGLTITDDLDWGQRVSEISAKATKTMGFLRCNLTFAPRHTKEVAYKNVIGHTCISLLPVNRAVTAFVKVW